MARAYLHLTLRKEIVALARLARETLAAIE
jgi:hypothetical protein